MFGAAWAGESDVAKVEVSTTAVSPGRLQIARQAGPLLLAGFWEFAWKAPAKPGRVTLMARATDSKGRTQPMEHHPNRRHYQISHVLPLEVEVR